MLDRRLGAKRLVTLAGITLLIQIADISGGWRNLNETAPISHDWPSPMQSTFWEVAPQRYRNVRAIPVAAINAEWINISYYASLHGMGSDAANLGRSDYAAFTRLADKAHRALENGSFEPDALYILDLPSAILARRFAKPEDLLGQIDKYFIFARGGATLAGNTAMPLPDLPALPVGQAIKFGGSGNGATYLPAGDWMPTADWGTAMSPPSANLGFRPPDAGAHVLHLLLASRSNESKAIPTPVQIGVDGKVAQTVAVPLDGTLAVDVDIPSGAIDGNAIVSLHIDIAPDAAQTAGVQPDIGVVSMTLGTAKPYSLAELETRSQRPQPAEAIKRPRWVTDRRGPFRKAILSSDRKARDPHPFIEPPRSRLLPGQSRKG